MYAQDSNRRIRFTEAPPSETQRGSAATRSGLRPSTSAAAPQRREELKGEQRPRTLMGTAQASAGVLTSAPRKSLIPPSDAEIELSLFDRDLPYIPPVGVGQRRVALGEGCKWRPA